MKRFKVLAALLITILLFCPVTFAKEKKAKEKEGSYSIEGIEVIQKRLFQKKYRHELSLSFGMLYDNAFVFYEMIPVQYTFYISESVGFEFTAAFAFGQEKGLVSSLRQDPYNIDVRVEKIKRYYAGNFMWSPIYGKFNIFASQIVHFDFFMTTGFGVMEDTVPDELVVGQNNKVWPFAFNVGAGVRAYLNEWMAIRVDFRNFTWKQGNPFNDIVNNRVLSLGVSFFLPPHKAEK